MFKRERKKGSRINNPWASQGVVYVEDVYIQILYAVRSSSVQ